MFFLFQIQSFETQLSVPELAAKEGGPETFRGVFIRAPAILEVGPKVEVLADYPVPSGKLFDSISALEAPQVHSSFYYFFFWPAIYKREIQCANR